MRKSVEFCFARIYRKIFPFSTTNYKIYLFAFFVSLFISGSLMSMETTEYLSNNDFLRNILTYKFSSTDSDDLEEKLDLIDFKRLSNLSEADLLNFIEIYCPKENDNPHGGYIDIFIPKNEKIDISKIILGAICYPAELDNCNCHNEWKRKDVLIKLAMSSVFEYPLAIKNILTISGLYGFSSGNPFLKVCGANKLTKEIIEPKTIFLSNVEVSHPKIPIVYDFDITKDSNLIETLFSSLKDNYYEFREKITQKLDVLE